MAGESEFGGRDTRSGVRKTAPGLLRAHEKLRLMYRTGDDNPDAPADPSKHVWRGTDKNFYDRPDIVEAKKKET